jgi:hypothetical protein
VAVKITLPK